MFFSFLHDADLTQKNWRRKVARGKRIGELLHELRDKQLAEELKTADEARAGRG
jgi:hypothetical protein